MNENCREADYSEVFTSINPESIHEMSFLIESIRIINSILNPFYEKIKPLWRKNQSKLASNLKTIVAALGNINKQLVNIKPIIYDKINIQNDNDEQSFGSIRKLFHNYVSQLRI